MKKRKIAVRISIGLDARELDALNSALEVRYCSGAGVMKKERNSFIAHAILAYSSAIARLGKQYEPGMLACDVRAETANEFAYRIGEPLQPQLPLNIVPLFSAA